MGRWTSDVSLYVPPNTLYDEVHLDRFIEAVQSPRFVFSGRLHPLLCALPSAQAVAFSEQREHADAPSGKFQAMLDDVFGYTFEENAWFYVDRACVIRYKELVYARMGLMRKLFATWKSHKLS